MAKKFSEAQWKKINGLFASSGEKFGLPERRYASIVLGTFNIRKLGKITNKSKGSWDFLTKVCERFDILAVQEVMDRLSGVMHLKDKLGLDYKILVSDVTGVYPGDSGNPERLAFLFDSSRVTHTELSSDITYDRSKIINTLYNNRKAFQKAWDDHKENLAKWREKKKARKAQGKKAPPKPLVRLPLFLSFIRQPYCASFVVPSKVGAEPIELMVVNAHLLYGDKSNKKERRMEFDALIDWLTIRAKNKALTYHKNFVMMGDCNFEFEDMNNERQEIDDHLRDLNKTVLKGKKAAKVNFPLLTKHPKHGELRTTCRLKDTYDQIAIFSHDDRLPNYKANLTAGENGADSYDYGVFNFSDLFAAALYNKKFRRLSKEKQKYIIDRTEHDISDHMPAWFRIPRP
jgi:endonuclease/exonuclease/phosphatase family metal-dependent hydrolase